MMLKNDNNLETIIAHLLGAKELKGKCFSCGTVNKITYSTFYEFPNNNLIYAHIICKQCSRQTTYVTKIDYDADLSKLYTIEKKQNG